MSAQNTTGRPVVVAAKPVANYALAIAARLGAGETTVLLRARGQHISKVFDAANMAVSKLALPLRRGDVRWGEEHGPEGKPVSFVEVELIGKEA